MTEIGAMWKVALAFVFAAVVGAGAAVILSGRTQVLPGGAIAAAIPQVEQTPPALPSPWNEDFFPNATVITHDGRELRFYDDLIKDKIVVVNFIYTSCSNICPLVTARLSQVKDSLGDRVGRDIFFLSITIDPITDGPEVLKNYAETYNAGPGWMFITGTPESIDQIRFKLGQRSNVKAEHRNDLMIGNDRTGTWGRDSAFSDPSVLADTIQSFDPAWRKPVKPAAVLAAADASLTATYKLQDRPGTILFAKACSGCHSIGGGKVVGPDLAGVLDRRDHDWLRRFLREPDVMRQQKDPIAVAIDEQFPGSRMPNLGLSDNDIDDLFAFFKNQESGTLASTGSKAEAPQPASSVKSN